MMVLVIWFVVSVVVSCFVGAAIALRSSRRARALEAEAIYRRATAGLEEALRCPHATSDRERCERCEAMQGSILRW